MSKNLLTIESFAEWAEKQPAEKTYDYWSNKCAWGQFLASRDIAYACVGCSTWTNKDGFMFDFPIGVADPTHAQPHTFGLLAARLRALSA